VRVQRDDLTVRGADGKACDFRSFAYDPVALVATWVLAKPFAADRVRLELDGDAPGGATDAAGNYLADGDVVRTFDILPGDANGDGVVNAIDLAYVKRHLGTSTFDFEGYSILADLNGDGRTNALDVAAIKQRLGRRLPAAPTTDLLRAN
jgi:hypothetical protein